MREVEHPAMLTSRAIRMTASEQTIQQGGDGQLPDLPTFGKLISPTTPRHGSIAKLHAALMACRPGAAADDRVAAIERLVAWLRAKANVATVADAIPGESPQVLRLRLLVVALRTVPAFRARLAFTLERVIGDSVPGGLFGRLGLPTDRGFFAETVDRVSRRYLPEPHDPRDLLQLVARMFPSEIHRRALVGMPPDPVLELTQLLRDATELDPWAAITVHLQDACALLATRISAVGLSDVIRARSPAVRLAGTRSFGCHARWTPCSTRFDAAATSSSA